MPNIDDFRVGPMALFELKMQYILSMAFAYISDTSSNPTHHYLKMCPLSIFFAASLKNLKLETDYE